MPKQRKYTDEQLKTAVANSISLRATLQKIGLVPAGGNYKHTKRRIDELGLDTSHWLGQGHLKNSTHGWAKTKPLNEVLVKNSTYQTYKLKRRLIKEKHLEEKCYNCNSIEWLGNPIPLELEHINGINDDHRIENLTLLCPNCHALTLTYRGKNKKKN